MTATMSIPIRKETSKRTNELRRIELAIIMKIEIIAHELKIHHDPDVHAYGLELECDDDDPKRIDLMRGGIISVLNEEGISRLRSFLLDLYLRTGTLVIL